MNALKHIAFIMDGNGRWAKKRMMPRSYGHREGVKAMERVVNYCDGAGIETVSFYAFSTENWSRPKEEVEQLFDMIKRFAEKEMKEYADRGYAVRFMGDMDALPLDTVEAINVIKNSTQCNTGMTVNIGINYGARDEIVRACNKVLANDDKITAETIGAALDTAGLSDPDLIVRSAGECRLSNFMLWQAAYSEFIFRKEFWPEFNNKILDEIIKEYAGRERRFGKI